MKLLRIVGARPQFMQAAILREALNLRGHQEILVHTGQHYDHKMSTIFFEQLGIPRPDFNLAIHTGSHNEQTGRMLIALDKVMQTVACDMVVVDGDTNSTLVGALAAAKMDIPLVHVEAGMRCYNKKSPEEINRVITDHVSDLLCVPTETAMNNLTQEGLAAKSNLTGDLMYDCFMKFIGNRHENILAELHLKSKQYILATIHRAENTQSFMQFKQIIIALDHLPLPVVLPLHPRTENLLIRNDAEFKTKYKNITFIQAVSYLEMLALEHHAETIVTDSGGVQREAYFSQVPSVILRDSTEWVEQVQSGWSVLSAIETEEILNSYQKLHNQQKQWLPNIYGDGNAADKIVSAIEGFK